MRKAFLWINFVLASLIVVLIFLQAYLITAYVSGAGDTRENALDAHGFVGFAIIHPAEALAFLTAFGAWPRAWKWIGFTFLLPLVGTIQIFLAPPDEDRASGWVHGFHGLLALVVLVLAAIVAHRGMRDLGLRRASPVGAVYIAPPPPLP
jgi:hypothetical protein